MDDADIKLYGEIHAADNNLRAYFTIFEDAKRNGYKKCFVEIHPNRQAAVDNQVNSARLRFDSKIALGIFEPQYAQGNYGQRAGMQLDFLAILSANTGIKLICSDVAKTPETRVGILKMAQMRSFKEDPSDEEFMEIFQMVTPELIMQVEYCSHEEALGIYAELKEEIKTGLFMKKLMDEMSKRFSEDWKVAHFIEQHREGMPAIFCGGQYHINPNRSDSLLSVLRRKNISAKAFGIVNGDVVPIRTISRDKRSLLKHHSHS